MNKSFTIPLARKVFLPKENNITKDDLEIIANGNYLLYEQGDNIIIKNNDCCRSIQVNVSFKEKLN